MYFQKIKIEFEPSEEFQCYKTTGVILHINSIKIEKKKQTNKKLQFILLVISFTNNPVTHIHSIDEMWVNNEFVIPLL